MPSPLPLTELGTPKQDRPIRGAARSTRGFKRLMSYNQYARNPAAIHQSKILGPQDSFLHRWNKIFLVSCVLSVAFDPLFFYIPIIDGKNKCIKLDSTLKVIACVLRTLSDLFYLLRIILQFRTGFIAPSSRVFGLGDLIQNTSAIAKRYVFSYLFVDVLAVLPFPQLLFIIPMVSGHVTLMGLLKVVIFSQYVPSSLGQNLKPSAFTGENLFAAFICVFGLLLFALLIGNMQQYLQSTTVREEKIRERRQDAERWMSDRLLPENLRSRIRRYNQYKWQKTRGFDEEVVIRNLPKELRRDIKRHLCLSLLTRVPIFAEMDEKLMDSLCDRLRPVLYTEGSYIVREGDPLEEMLFIKKGRLITTSYGGRTGYFNSAYLAAGDFIGDELLTWALEPHSSSNLSISTRTVQSKTEVEAFALLPDDLKFVASQYRRLHGEGLRHTFRFYSRQWRTWAACFIQMAWRRYYKRKIEKCLQEAAYDALAMQGESSTSLGTTIFVSRFATNALQGLRRNRPENDRPNQRESQINLQKPADPDFASDDC